MGGKQKILTQTRRKALGKEMMDAIIAGTFTLNQQPLDTVLDEVNQGIKDGRYPIEIDLAQLIAIWSGTPAPATEAPAAEPTNHGTVDQIQQAQLAAQQNGHTPPTALAGPVQQIPVNVHAGNTVNGLPAEQWQAQQAAAGHGPTPQQAAEMGLPANAPTIQPSLPPTAYGQQVAAPMTLQQAQAAMQTVETMEVGQPPKEEPIPVDASPVAEWIALARQAQAKIDSAKDIVEQAKANVAAYLDQQGGPDRSKVAVLDGRAVMRRTFIRRGNFSKTRLAAAHPEIDIEAFTDESTYYRTELV